MARQCYRKRIRVGISNGRSYRMPDVVTIRLDSFCAPKIICDAICNVSE